MKFDVVFFDPSISGAEPVAEIQVESEGWYGAEEKARLMLASARPELQIDELKCVVSEAAEQ